ncbi:hypothetical protein ABTX77_26835 [Streptomyces sp. NPDC097704]|uniref:hypothetical protein n=1 Tax=Streptomyces sp. NPDC097704 TaxID=3157101 RepID=UPI00331C5C78
MPMKHTCEGRILALSLPADLDVAERAAATLHLHTLFFAYRPRGVRLHVSHGPASPASLSVLARVHRLCEGLGIPVTLTDLPWPPRTRPAEAALSQAPGPRPDRSTSR